MVGCSSDDDEDITSGEILGEWTMVFFEYNGNSTIKSSGINVSSDYIGKAKNINFMITFTENPNQVLGSGSYDLELTLSTLGVSDTKTTSISDIDTSADWSRNEGTLSKPFMLK